MDSWLVRPTLGLDYYKAHGLGNDYLVFEEGGAWQATQQAVQRVCDRHRGVGSDGIVVLLNQSGEPTWPGERPEGEGASTGRHRRVALRMFNPDGGEFERSGNGLRVLASYLVSATPQLQTIDAFVGGSIVRMHVHGRSGPIHDVSCHMGRAETGASAVSLDAAAIGRDGLLAGPDGERLAVVPVSVGNPHLVVLVPDASAAHLSEERLAALGPFFSSHAGLRHGANVQIAASDGSGHVRALIWERGVGRTSASGTSACAVAVALVSSGRRPPGEVSVEMPGGTLEVDVSKDLDVVLRGPVEEVCEGRLRYAPAP